MFILYTKELILNKECLERKSRSVVGYSNKSVIGESGIIIVTLKCEWKPTGFSMKILQIKLFNQLFLYFVLSTFVFSNILPFINNCFKQVNW